MYNSFITKIGRARYDRSHCTKGTASNTKKKYENILFNVSVTSIPELNRVLTSTGGTQVNHFTLGCHRHVTDLLAWAQPRCVFFKNISHIVEVW
jgi:hypothetical protein